MTVLLALLLLIQGRDPLLLAQDPNSPPAGQEPVRGQETPQDPAGSGGQTPPPNPGPQDAPPQNPPQGQNQGQNPPAQDPGAQPPAEQPQQPPQNPPEQDPAQANQPDPNARGRNNRQNNQNQRPQPARPGGAPSAPGQPQLPPIQDLGDALVLMFDETNDTLDLLSLTKLCQETAKINFIYDSATATSLSGAKVNMLGPKVVPKSEFYTFYQNIMFINQFTCTRVGKDETSVVLIQATSPQQGARGQQVKAEPLYVDSADLEQYSGQVATQVMTVLHLPHTDVRNLQQSMRVLGQDTAQNVIPIANTSSVILTGSGSTVAMYARVLRLVDEEAAKEGSIAPAFEIIPLEYASGEDVADMLDQLLEANRRAQQAARAGQAQGATAPIQSQNAESKIIVDKRTNALIVMAMPEDMVNIKELIAQLDVDVVEPERTYHIYALDNVPAEDLAETLKDFIQDSSRVQPAGPSGRGGEGGAPTQGGRTGSASANEVVVVPDKSTNSLLIAAGKSRYEEVLDMVRKLDRRQDQVLIETALVELTGRNFRDLGVELGFADIPGADALGGFGITSFGLSTLTDINSDGVPDVRVPNFTDGVAAGIIDGDDFSLPVLITAIQTLRDSNVLSVPSVLVNNNGSAKVSTLDEQPTTTITATGGGGVGGQTQENFNGYQEAGITLQISPSISASGYLRLNVYLKVANFLGITTGAIPPPRITREISTVVNVPDGDTMVVGGIVIDNNVHNRQQVPWLGDIPVLGWLFARDTDTQDRTTLYFFVTPHIMRDKDFADLSEYSYRIKLNASEVIGADRIQVIDKTLGRIQREDFGGFEVPLYRSPKRGEVEPSAVGIDAVKRSEMLQEQSQTELEKLPDSD